MQVSSKAVITGTSFIRLMCLKRRVRWKLDVRSGEVGSFGGCHCCSGFNII